MATSRKLHQIHVLPVTLSASATGTHVQMPCHRPNTLPDLLLRLRFWPRIAKSTVNANLKQSNMLHCGTERVWPRGQIIQVWLGRYVNNDLIDNHNQA